MYLEDGTIVIAPLIPWSIAGAVPLASMGAPGLRCLQGVICMPFLYGG